MRGPEQECTALGSGFLKGESRVVKILRVQVKIVVGQGGFHDSVDIATENQRF